MNAAQHHIPPSETQARVTASDLPIFYRYAGSGVAPPLVLIHGWGGSSRYWRNTLAALGSRRTVYGLDLPGFGDTPPLASRANFEQLAGAVLAFVDALGLERFDLNGHSFSGSVAALVASRHPHRVRRLVLTCFSTFCNEFERRMVDQVHNVIALWMSLRRPWMARYRPFYRTVASRFFHRVPADDAILHESFADFMKMDRRTALESAASSGDPAITSILRNVRAPSLIIGARQDSIMPSAGIPQVARLIPDSRLVWIESCGHLPMIERPDLYHQLVGSFLDGETS